MLSPRHRLYDDLIQEGNIGAMKAAPRWSPSRGVRFSDYAGASIRKYMLNVLVADRVFKVGSTLYWNLRREEKKEGKKSIPHGRLAKAESLEGIFAEGSGEEAIVEEAMSRRFVTPSMTRISTIRTKRDGTVEPASFLVLRQNVDGRAQILTESLSPESVEGTRVLQVELSDGQEKA